MANAYLFAMLAVTPSGSREVSLIANPEFEAGRVAGHRARRLIDGANPAFSDPFLVMAEDWVPRDAFSRHPHRGIETVTLVLDGELEHFGSAGNTGVIYTGDAQWMTAGRGVIHNENPLPGHDGARASALGEPARQREDGSAALPGSQRGRPSHATGAGCRFAQLRGRFVSDAEPCSGHCDRRARGRRRHVRARA
jgi:hypothetical protein